MKELIEKTTTKAGFKESMRIVFDEHLKQWNYTTIPGVAIL
jgi:hypothetical protein